MISLFVPVITHPASLLTANKRLSVCHGICITLRCLPSSPTLSLSPHPSSHNHYWYFDLCPTPPPSPPPSSPSTTSSSLWCFTRCVRTHCRLALDDAIRHKQLNISRFSPRVAGENDFLQTVINKVITAKEVNHKGQGTVPAKAGVSAWIQIHALKYYIFIHYHHQKMMKEKVLVVPEVQFFPLRNKETIR